MAPSQVERVLALQRSAGNLHVAQALGRRPRPGLARTLDTDFEHAGKPTKEEKKTCDAFAAIVSDFVDEAHLALLAGRVKDWEGAKITAFLKLLTAGKTTAVVHAGNVIEERVYALMKSAKLPAPWTPQFSASMGGASRPDVVINLPSGNEGLIDITSQRAHILGKAGSWTTSETFVYVAEAWFPSILADHLPHIRKAIKDGGIGDEELAAMQASVAEQRKNRKEQRDAELREAREIRASYSSHAAFVREAFEGDKRAAEEWMREHGMANYKGVPKKKGPRKISAETRAKRKKLAAKTAKLKAKAAFATETETAKKPEGRESVKAEAVIDPTSGRDRRKASALDVRKAKRLEAHKKGRPGAEAVGAMIDEEEQAEVDTTEPEFEFAFDDPTMETDAPEGLEADEGESEDIGEEPLEQDEDEAEVDPDSAMVQDPV